MPVFSRFLSNTQGATAVEYSIIAAAIAIAISTVVYGLGANLGTKYQSIDNALK